MCGILAVHGPSSGEAQRYVLNANQKPALEVFWYER
jgi:hypothetical protein